jgi:hypothetical protein
MKPVFIINIILVLIAIAALGASIYTQYDLYKTRKDHETEVANLNSKIAKQKADKDTIRGLWEDQAASNDKMVGFQDELNVGISSYISEFKNSIRFVNTKPEILPTVSEKNIKDSESLLTDKQKNLKEVADQILISKKTDKEKIDALYLNAGEDQNNRANIREGTK